MLAKVNRIIPFSNVDGPGNRMAIFLQGCPFNCWYCHNPETIHTCMHCAECIEGCPVHALSVQGDKVVWDPITCVNCDQCIQTCRHDASPKIVLYSVEELMKKIRYQKAFIQGITISGGECMMHADFLTELSVACKNENISMLIDSNGYVDFSLYPVLLENIDGVMLDVKAYDPAFHQALTGCDNQMVLKNLNYLLAIGKLEEVRTVLLPQHIDETYHTLYHVCKLIDGKCRYKWLKYRPYGVRNQYLDVLGHQIFEDIKLDELKSKFEAKDLHQIVCI